MHRLRWPLRVPNLLPAASGDAARPLTANVVKMPVQNVITLDAGTGRVDAALRWRGQCIRGRSKGGRGAPGQRDQPVHLRRGARAHDGRRAIASGGPIAQYDVVVRPSRYGAAEAEATVARVLPGASAYRDIAEWPRHHRTGEDAGRRRSGDADRSRLSASRANRRQPPVRRHQHSGEPARAHRGNEPQPDPPVGGELEQSGRSRQVRRSAYSPTIRW